MTITSGNGPVPPSTPCSIRTPTLCHRGGVRLRQRWTAAAGRRGAPAVGGVKCQDPGRGLLLSGLFDNRVGAPRGFAVDGARSNDAAAEHDEDHVHTDRIHFAGPWRSSIGSLRARARVRLHYRSPESGDPTCLRRPARSACAYPGR